MAGAVSATAARCHCRRILLPLALYILLTVATTCIIWTYIWLEQLRVYICRIICSMLLLTFRVLMILDFYYPLWIVKWRKMKISLNRFELFYRSSFMQINEQNEMGQNVDFTYLEIFGKNTYKLLTQWDSITKNYINL